LYANEALALAEKLNFQKGIALALTNAGDALFYKGEYKNSIKQLKKAADIYEKEKDNQGLINAYISLGQSWKELGRLPDAIDYYLLALKASEKIHDHSSTGRAMISLGVLFLDMGKYPEAMKYSKDALPFIILVKDTAQIANAHARIGNVFGAKSNPSYNLDSTIWYYEKSLKLFKKINHLRGIAVIYNNMAAIYQDENDHQKAIESYKQAYVIRSTLGDQNGMAIILNNLGSTYKTLKNYKLALQYLEKSLNILLKINRPDLIADNYKLMSGCYASLGEFQKAYYYQNLYVEFNDSLNNDFNSKIITEMQVKYETDKKEQEIEILNQNRILNALQLKQQRDKVRVQKYFIYSSVSVLIVVLTLSFFLSRLYFQKKKANVLLEVKNSEIMQQKEEISTQRDEIEAQRDMVITQKDKIEEIHEELTSSIRYAQRIQTAVLPSSEQMEEILGEHFVFFVPKDIVSGDFFWATRIKNRIVFCVADCTGHGVPGAFMSMLGITFLHEILSNKLDSDPAQVLNDLRKNVVESLKQQGRSMEQKDGMDISLCIIDTETNILQFAGANNPVYIIRNQELTELKADKMPIAIHERMTPFTLNKFNLQKNDCVYLFSDGYADQFGNSDSSAGGLKFKYKPFKSLLIEHSYKQMTKQKSEIEKAFYHWKGDLKQVDDITLLGFRV
jgi:serine phosphatase RsbU (regulator of sigma subunit)